MYLIFFFFFFFFNDTATTEIYTLSLHDALPISHRGGHALHGVYGAEQAAHRLQRGRLALPREQQLVAGDRKSTRLNSSHLVISYAVFCLKKKKKNKTSNQTLVYLRASVNTVMLS